VRAGDLGNVNEVEAGVDVGRELAVEKVDEDAAGGRGLSVVGADGCGRVENDDFLAVLRGSNSLLLGEELGALVVSDHVGERYGRVFIDDDAIGAEVHGGDAGGVDDARDFGLTGEAEQVAGTVDIGEVHGVGIANPEAVIGGHVHYGIAAGECGGEGLGVGEIADDGVPGDAFEILEVASFADQHSKIGAFSGEGIRYVVAYESGCAGEKDFHRGSEHRAVERTGNYFLSLPGSSSIIHRCQLRGKSANCGLLIWLPRT